MIFHRRQRTNSPTAPTPPNMKYINSQTPARYPWIAALLLAVIAPTTPLFAAFGVTASNGGYIVDNGANLVFTVNSSGDIPSCKYKGIEFCSTKASGIASGLGASSVTATTTSSTITIKCVSTSIAPSALTHYYIVKSGVDNIYLATYVTSEPNVGELRYIFRAKASVLPNGPAPSNNSGNTGAIESADIFGHSDGTTTSKYYGNERAKDLTVKGATGSGVGLFMAFGTRESSSGGPFYHDIENQNGGDQEIYNYMNSGHNQTEAYRVNVLHGPYAYCFTNGSTPAVPDMSFISGLGLTGYVPASSRGHVVLNGISGMNSSFTYTVGFANTTAQYWTKADPTTGACSCSNMKAGTYAMTIYKGELPVWTGSVSVPSGSGVSVNTITITADPSKTATIWRIGDWDGTPNEFLNGQTLISRHPSDSRNPSWGPVTYAVGSAANRFPAVQFRGANSPTKITFSLSSAQAAAAHTLKIGITDSYASGRPGVTINGHALTNPGATTEPNSRSFTTGSYRGNNNTYTWSIPSADFVSGANTLTITPISGSSDLSAWLSASFSYDCVELDN